MLRKPTGWANQSNERGLAWANRANPCKSYYSSAYIDVGTGVIAFCSATVQNELFLHVAPRRIAFCGAKPCKTSYSSSVYIDIGPVRIAFFVAQSRANVFLGFGVLGKPNGLGGPVSSPNGLGRTSIKPKRVGRTRQLCSTF